MYDSPGVYNIHLLADEGLPTQTEACKSVVVMPSPTKLPLLDTGFCKGDSMLIKTNFPEKTYSWNTGSADSVIQVNTSGIYWMESEYHGCTVRDSIDVKQNLPPVVDLGKDTSFCGLDSLLLDAGNSGANYQWQDGSTKQTYAVTSAGTYSVMVTDQNGCQNKDTIQVSTMGNATLTISADTTICSGYNVVLHASGADNYRWSPSSTLSADSIPNPVASPSSSTMYYLSATDSAGCSGNDSVFVKVLPQPTIALLPDTSICTGSSVVLRTNSSNAIIFNWTPVTTLNNSGDANPIAKPTTLTKYIVTAGNGVCSVQDSVTIDLLPLPIVTVSNDTTICGSAQAQLNAMGGIAYTWTPNTGLSNPNIANPFASPVATTKYIVHVKGTNTCIADDSVLITVKPKPAFAINPSAAGVCLGDSLLLTASGGDVYQWSPSNLVSSPDSSVTWIHPLAATTYKVIYYKPCM